MKCSHYVYRQVNKATGEYYIGKGTYSARDPDGSKYKGSGILLLRKMSAHPYDFEKIILKEFESEQDAYEYERAMVGEMYIGGRDHDPLCLNMNSGGMGTSSDFMRNYYRNHRHRQERSIESKRRWERAEYRIKLRASQALVRDQRIKRLKETMSRPDVQAKIKDGYKCPIRRAKLREKAKPSTLNIERDGHTISIPYGHLRDYLVLGWALCSKGVVNIHRSDIGVYSCGQHDVVKHLIVEHGFVFGTNFALNRVTYDTISKLSGVKEAKAKGQMDKWSCKPVVLVDPEGQEEAVPRHEYLDRLENGYIFKSASVQVRNHKLKQTALVSRARAKALLVLRGDWELGSKRGYRAVSAKSV
jgi:hypothetical protein